MTQAEFDPTKPCRTRDGREVEIIRTDLRNDKPILAIVKNPGGDAPYSFYSDGCFFMNNSTSHDLVNIPPEPTEGHLQALFAAALNRVRLSADNAAYDRGAGDMRSRIVRFMRAEADRREESAGNIWDRYERRAAVNKAAALRYFANRVSTLPLREPSDDRS